MDTIRNKAALLALLADNSTGDISPQDMRDIIVTLYFDMEATGVLGPYLYIGYALDASGTGFTTTFNASLNYIAFLNSPTEILVPVQADFTGLWAKYKNNAIVGSNVYIAYADDNIGTGFTETFDSSKNYIGIIASPTPLTPVVGDFAGKWKNYTNVFGGATGSLLKHNGTQYVSFPKGGANQQIRVNAAATDLEYFTPFVANAYTHSSALQLLDQIVYTDIANLTLAAVPEGVYLLTFYTNVTVLNTPADLLYRPTINGSSALSTPFKFYMDNTALDKIITNMGFASFIVSCPDPSNTIKVQYISNNAAYDVRSEAGSIKYMTAIKFAEYFPLGI